MQYLGDLRRFGQVSECRCPRFPGESEPANSAAACSYRSIRFSILDSRFSTLAQELRCAQLTGSRRLFSRENIIMNVQYAFCVCAHEDTRMQATVRPGPRAPEHNHKSDSVDLHWGKFIRIPSFRGASKV